MKCKTHPTYKALKPPASCIHCLVLYQQKQLTRLEDEVKQLQSAVLECAEVANENRIKIAGLKMQADDPSIVHNRFIGHR